MSTIERDQTDGVTVQRRHRNRMLGIALGLLAMVFAVALVLAWFRWGRFNPGVVGVHLSPMAQAWYSLLMFLSTVAVAITLPTCALQLGHWLERRPRAHRFISRCYVFAGVYPTVVLAIVVESLWPFSVVTVIPQVAFYVLWTAVTTYAVVLGRRGRADEQRRWMVRSYALTGSILLKRLIVEPVMGILLGTELHTRLGGSIDVLMQLKDSNVDWIGLAVAIVVGEWILERRRTRELTPAR
jgi:hypothetical protein